MLAGFLVLTIITLIVDIIDPQIIDWLVAHMVTTIVPIVGGMGAAAGFARFLVKRWRKSRKSKAAADTHRRARTPASMPASQPPPENLYGSAHYGAVPSTRKSKKRILTVLGISLAILLIVTIIGAWHFGVKSSEKELSAKKAATETAKAETETRKEVGDLKKSIEALAQQLSDAKQAQVDNPPAAAPPSPPEINTNGARWGDDIKGAQGREAAPAPSEQPPADQPHESLAEKLAAVNNFYSAKFTPTMAAAGATDTGIEATDGLTYAAFRGRQQAHNAMLALLTVDYRDRTVDYTLDRLSHGNYNGSALAGTTGINPNAQVGNLSGNQLEALLGVIEKNEGITAAAIRAGNLPTQVTTPTRTWAVAENATPPQQHVRRRLGDFGR
jgi:hypothetical protein